MSRAMPRLLLTVICAGAVLGGLPRHAAAEDGALKTGQRLRKLEKLQTGEATKLDTVVGDFAWLLEDLASNGLLERGDVEKVKTFRATLDAVAGKRMPIAAGHLRNARLDHDESRRHTASADKEIDAILSDLAKVLAGSSALLAEGQLVRELKDLIKVQTRVRSQTAEWGKALLISPETAGAGKGPLMQDQAKIMARYQTFLGKLQKAGKDALDEATKARLLQAERVLNPPPPSNEIVSKITTPEPTTGDVLQAAADQIEHVEVLSAVGAQDRAIASFKAALQILSAGQFELAEFVAGLEKLIAKQKALRKDTDAEEDLENKRSFYEARQIEIQDEVTDYSFEAPDLFVSKAGEYLVEPLMAALEGAVSAIKSAEKEKALASQDKVIALLESVYGTAAEALEEKEGDPFWAYSPEIPEDKWKLPNDGDEEDAPMKDEDMPDIFEGVISAELMIQPDNVAQGAQADVKTALAANRFIGLEEDEGDDEPPDFITDTGPPSVGRDKAPDDPGGKGEGDTSKVEADRLAREAMQRRRQKAKIQDYVRQLPPEFRRQVTDYYEVIAE